MSTPEQARQAAAGQERPSPSMLAHADQQDRIAADIAAMQAGPTEHMAEQMNHCQGLPTVQTQMATHGAAPPRVPDTGGRG